MDQERIGKFIKEIRTKNNLSQNEFAKKYGVTYQAVSKWENGKNMPDIQILKQICSDYNLSIEELLNAEEKTKKKKIIPYIIISLIILVSLIIGIILLNKEEETFEFKTLSSTTEYFKLTGSIAYNQDKTSIYISDIRYTGDDTTEYKEIKSTLYEVNGKTKKEIATYNKALLITLNDFVSGMSFHSDDHASICKEYTEENLLIEITATTIDNKSNKYEIPIIIGDNCQK